MEEKSKKLWKLFIAFAITKGESKGCENTAGKLSWKRRS